MENLNKPRLVFFQWNHKNTSKFVQLHMQLHVKCLSEFFEVFLINENSDYQEICDRYEPDLTLFEGGVKYSNSRKIYIKNTSAHPGIPKLGLYNGDSWCDCRAGFLSDMERWGVETFFSICATIAEHTPEISENLFVWPNFIDPEICRDYNQPRVIPVLINGNISPLYPWRQKISKLVSDHYPSLICPHLGYENRSEWRMLQGEQYVRVINASWFVPTCGTVAKEVIRKHFEIPASKSCLITERSPALEAAGFIDMQNCVFADEHDVLDRLDYLFQHQDKLEKIINSGYELAHSSHTLKQRDQIFQWFNLHKNLQSNQKIVQSNPFQPLTIADQSAKPQNSYFTCHGLDVMLLRRGDEKLWSGKYEEAETSYLSCLDYIHWMPEPKLKLALCSLYRGDAKAALDWVIQSIKYTLEVYEAFDPDPVEWAYCIISLLCLGEFEPATKHANEFLSLRHPELDRIRWVIDVLSNGGNTVELIHDEQAKHRFSIHNLPNRSFNEWIEHLCIMLNSCQQFDLAEALIEYTTIEHPLQQQKKQFSSTTTGKLIKQSKTSKIKWLENTPFFSKVKYIMHPYPFKNRLVVKLRRRLKLRTRLSPLLARYKAWFRRFIA